MSVLQVANIHFNSTGSERLELIGGNVKIYTAGNLYINDLLAGTGSDLTDNLARITANASFDKANSANLLAFNTGVGANAYASGVGSNANAFASATIAGANAAVGLGANLYAFAVGVGANSFARETITGANTAVGGGANAFTSATIAGANTAVGGGANAFATAATVAANNFAGTMANAANSFMITVQNGSNTAVGTAANNFAGTMANAANSFMISTVAGANAAVGTAANNFAGTMANAANAFMSSTIAGANAAVGVGANSVGIAAFTRANASVNAININGTITLTSNSTQINVVASNGVTLAANNFAGIARLNIGLSTTGVTATTYGGASITPVITVDPYGRITSVSNVTSAGGSGGGAAFDAANAAFAQANVGTGNVSTAAVRTGNVAPTGVVANTLWWNSETGRLFIFYNDGDSSQWVEAVADGVVGPAGLNASITVATATVVAPNQPPTVINTGNTIFANLSFSLPRAYTVAVNNTIGIPYVNPPVVNNSPSANTTDLRLDFYIPKGNIGNVGPKSVTLLYPATNEDFTIFYNYDVARTLSRVSTVLVPVGAATGPNVTFTIRYAADRSSVGTEVLTGGMVANTITGQGAGSNITTFTNATIPTNNWLWLETSNATSNTYSFTVSLDFLA